MSVNTLLNHARIILQTQESFLYEFFLPNDISSKFNMNAFEIWKDTCEQALVKYPWIDARSVSPVPFLTDKIRSGIIFNVNRKIDLKDWAERIVQEVAPPIFNLHASWKDNSRRTVEIYVKLTLVNKMGGVIRYGCVDRTTDCSNNAIIEAIESEECEIVDHYSMADDGFTTVTFTAKRAMEEYPNTIVIKGNVFYRLTSR